MIKASTVVVTGGAGFIGSNLTDALVARGYSVHIIDDLSVGKREHVHQRATLHIVDIRDRGVLDGVMSTLGDIACIFHLAAKPRVQYSIEHPQETYDINVTGTLNMLEAAHVHRASKFVYAASSSAYGNADTLPLSEEMPPQPKSPYGLQKHMGELLCRMYSTMYKLPTVSLRYFNVYGPRLDPEGHYALVIGKFLKQRKERKPLTITGDGTQTRDFTHVRDVVAATMRAMKSDKVGRGEVINIGAGNNVSVLKLAELIGGPITHIPPRIEPHDTLADTTRARMLLGWSPSVSFEDGISELKQLFGIV